MATNAPAMDPLRVVFDRSRVESYEKCPRQRFLGYEYGGTGLQPARLETDLFWGICAHQALGDIMLDVKAGRTPDPYTAAIKAANYFEIEAHKRGLKLEQVVSDLGPIDQPVSDLAPLDSPLQQQKPDNQYQDMTIKLASTWIRLAVPAWAFTKLPLLLQQYEIVTVEQEVNWESLQGDVLMTRHDATLRDRTNGRLYVLNFKTVGEVNKWWLDGWRYDQQTISEVLAVEQLLSEQVAGVNIVGLIKGKKAIQYPKDSGMWFNSSPFVWCWKKEAAAPFPAEYAAKYEWTDDTGNHRLGKGWRRVPVWEEFADLTQWMEWLEQNEPELVRAQFVEVPTIMRSDREAEEWKGMVLPRERHIRYQVNDILQADSNGEQHDAEALLNEYFPKHTGGGNCIRPSACPFIDVCWGSAAIQPLEFGFTHRQPNHQQEMELRSKP